jgi:hypothetical protein
MIKNNQKVLAPDVSTFNTEKKTILWNDEMVEVFAHIFSGNYKHPTIPKFEKKYKIEFPRTCYWEYNDRLNEFRSVIDKIHE